MKIASIVNHLETIAPTAYQESYDNAGLLTGSTDWECSGALTALDCTEAVVREAIDRQCNLIIAHHPIIFTGLKRITGSSYVEKTVLTAIKNDVALYAMHTNLDNMPGGVNDRIADRLCLTDRRILLPRSATLKKLYTFVPTAELEKVRSALFQAGSGHIGDYSETSFAVQGEGSFKAGEGAKPFVGEIGKRHHENEIRIETVFPAHLQPQLLAALKAAHPYEEPAIDIVALDNPHERIGSGLIGALSEPMGQKSFLDHIKQSFSPVVIKHTRLLDRPVLKVAVCGGAGSFLISSALSAGADFYITADVKYHEFFDANDRLVLADIGHYESERFTIDLLQDILLKKFPTFAVLKTALNTNPVSYY